MHTRLALAVFALALGWLARPMEAAEAPADQAAGHLPKEAKALHEAAPAESNCCPSLQDTAESPSCGGITVGAGVYFLRPVWTTNPAYHITGPGGAGNDIQTDFDFDYVASPVIWLGYESQSGLGARVRWWHLDHQEILQVSNPGGGPLIISAAPLGLGNASAGVNDRLQYRAELSLQVWDFEATQRVVGESWSLLATGGFRYAHIHQDYDHTEVPRTGPATVDAIFSGHNFNGFGPTLSLEGRRRLGASGFHLYGNVRGSFLWGDARERAFEITNGALPPVINSAERVGLLPIGEMEVGAEWRWGMAGTELFARVGLMGQGWFGAGNASNNGDITETGNNFRSLNNNIDLGLFGITLTAGLGF